MRAMLPRAHAHIHGAQHSQEDILFSGLASSRKDTQTEWWMWPVSLGTDRQAENPDPRMSQVRSKSRSLPLPHPHTQAATPLGSTACTRSSWGLGLSRAEPARVPHRLYAQDSTLWVVRRLCMHCGVAPWGWVSAPSWPVSSQQGVAILFLSGGNGRLWNCYGLWPSEAPALMAVPASMPGAAQGIFLREHLTSVSVGAQGSCRCTCVCNRGLNGKG